MLTPKTMGCNIFLYVFFYSLPIISLLSNPLNVPPASSHVSALGLANIY